MNSSVRAKIEKFIDSHGSELVLKVQRKRKHPTSSSTANGKGKMTESPASVVSSEETKPTPIQQPQSSEVWQDIPTSPSANKRRFIDDSVQDTSPSTIIDNKSTKTPPIQQPAPSSQKEDIPYYYSRRSRVSSPTLYNAASSSSSRYAGEYVRPGYSRHYSSYYRYPPRPPSPYYRGSSSSSGGRYYSSNGGRGRSPPPYYHHHHHHHHHRHSASSSRRGSLSDDDMDSRRRWD
jgi:hypothetical protein